MTGRSSIRERGGDPLLWQHLFWLFGHPEVYIIFLPSVALIAMIVPTFAQRPIVGYSWIVLAAVGTGFLSFGLWVHHMFTTGLPGITLGLFSAASQAVALPTGVQIFCFIATLAAGRVVPSVPMLWAFGSLVIFVLGGLTGVMVAVAPFDFQAHDTFFVVAHLHYVLIGGALFPIFAGCYYFYPLISGKMLSDKLGKIAFWLAFIGFNIAFLPMHVTGLRGMPRRVFTYPAGMGFDGLNLVSTIGAFILAAGVARGLLGYIPAKAPSTLRRAQSVARRDHRVDSGNARPALGHSLDSGNRQPLSVVGPGEFHSRHRRGQILFAGCARKAGVKRSSLRCSMPSRNNARACRGPVSSRCGRRLAPAVFLFSALIIGGPRR